MNRGEFKGSGIYELLEASKVDKSKMPEFYATEKFSEIEQQIETQAKDSLKLIEWLYAKLPLLKEEYKNKT